MRELPVNLRHAVRRAAAAPAASLAIVMAIALGVGATTAIVSVMEATFLEPLPFPQPDRLVRLGTSMRRLGVAPEVNALDAADWVSQSRTLAGIGLYDVEDETLHLDGLDAPLSVSSVVADRHMPAVLGIRPHVGRGFTADDFARGAGQVVVLGHRFWRETFGADASVVGRTIGLGSGRPTIVGVWSEAADRFPAGGGDLWTPLVYSPDSFLNQRGSIALSAVGRLGGGVSIASVAAELSTIAGRLAVAHPDTNTGRDAIVEPLQAAMVGPVRPIILLIAFSVAAVLTIACANIANLLLAQTSARSRELATRTALGATRVRLALQLTGESLTLFAVAGMLGVALAPPMTSAILARYPGTLPLAADVALDGRVLLIALCVTIGAALIAIVPGLRALGHRSLAAGLNDTSRGLVSRAQTRLARALIVGQIAVSIVLFIGAAALLRTVLMLSSVKTGLDASALVTMRLTLPESAGSSPERVLAFQDSVRDLAASLPGVERAAHAMFLPFTAGRWRDGYARAGMADSPPNLPMADFFMVSPEYLGTVGLPIRQGRDLTARDDASAPPVLVVNETFAARAFPGQQAVGRRVLWSNRTWEIVGVTADSRHASLWELPDADVYVPRAQNIRANTWLTIRTSRPADAIALELRSRLRALDPGATLSDVRPMADRITQSTSTERFRAVLTGSLGSLALLLAAIGVFGVVSYTVARRTRDIGIRLALGESRASIVRQVLLGIWGTTAMGAAMGVGTMLLLGRVIESQVPGMRVRETGTLLVVLAVFFVVATLAALGPARRASRVDVIDALRFE